MWIVSCFKKFLLTGWIVINACTLFAHENTQVHPAITSEAYKVWTGKDDVMADLGLEETQTFINQYLTTDTPLKNLTMLQWLQKGCIYEDTPLPRCFAHFYDPIGHKGLIDGVLPAITFAPDSYTWATSGTGYVSYPVSNQETWVKARDYYWLALTDTSAVNRDKAWAHSFYSLGKVVHLLEDLSQPDHVRNDAHLDYRWIEDFGVNNYRTILGNLTALQPLNWRQAGFKRVKDFWDRGIYNGSGAALDADAANAPGARLGLSEFINGNLMGEDSLYSELTTLSPLHHFPHPAITDTNLNQILSNQGIFGAVTAADTWQDLATSDTPTNKKYRSVFIRKERSGIIIEHHSMLNYSAYFGQLHGQHISNMPAVTINAPSVLAEYHKIAFTKAIQYTAGLLDYFFRGKLEAHCDYDEQTQRYNVSIYNSSDGLPFNGGAFTIYWDDAEGKRTAYTGLTSTYGAAEGLAYYDLVKITIPVPSPGAAVDAKKAMVVFQGTIGKEGDDPDDAGKAIAAIQIDLPTIPVPQPEILVTTVSASKSKCGTVKTDPDIPETPPRYYKTKKVCSGTSRVTLTYSLDEDGNCTAEETEACNNRCYLGFLNEADGIYYGTRTTTLASTATGLISQYRCTLDSFDMFWQSVETSNCEDQSTVYSGYWNAEAHCPFEYPYEQNPDSFSATVDPQTGEWIDFVSTGIWADIEYPAASETVVYSDPYPSSAAEYANEDTTTALIDRTFAALPDYSTLELYGNAVASRSLAEDESGFSITRSKYQFRFQKPLLGAGKQYKLSWVERTLPDAGGGGAVGAETEKTWVWDGNVPSDYDASDAKTWPVSPVYELKEPSANGTTTVADVIATITTAP